MTANPLPPTAPVMPPPTSGGSSGSGCLRGCAIAAGALLALLLCGFASLYLFGRPYLAARLPAIRENSPLLGLAIDLIGIDDLVEPQRTVDPSARYEGANDKPAIPADVALMPEPLTETYQVSAERVTGYQEVPQPVDEVAAYLSGSMAENGWEAVSEDLESSRALLLWGKDGSTCTAELVAADYLTEVWLRCNLAVATATP
ncbi:MAG: hypothetical protein ACYC5O_07515 [Anaerolineae bacterium]